MKNRNLVLMVAMATACVGVVGVGSLLPSTAVAASAKKETVSQKVLKPLQAAQEAMKTQNWDEALSQLNSARATDGLTPYDSYMIDELSWYSMLQKKDYTGSAAALERVVGSPYMNPADMTQRLKALTQMNLQIKNYGKAAEFGTKYLAANPGDTEVATQVATAMYLNKDFNGARAMAEKLAAGPGKPSEGVLQLLLRLNADSKNEAGAMQALESLVRNYPQTKYWDDLLTNQLYRTRDDRAMRYIYRLMEDTNTLNKGENMQEMGALLITGGFPGEAKRVLERGTQLGKFEGDVKNRATIDLDKARSQAAIDAKDLSNADKALAAAKTGNEMVATGKLFFSSGEYGKAADAIQKGLAKGGVTDADDARMLQGVALSRAGKGSEAAAAFSAVRDPKLADVARLWKLKVETTTPAG